VTSRQHQESRRIGLSDRIERRRRHELIGQLLDKGIALKEEGDIEKAVVCFETAGELVGASR
jgi:hypothetical protein